MGRLRTVLSVGLLSAALLPALLPRARQYDVDISSLHVPLVEAFGNGSVPKFDLTKLVAETAALDSLGPYANLGKPDFDKARFETSKAAWEADPTVQAAKRERQKVGAAFTRRDQVRQARALVAVSGLCLFAAIVVLFGFRRIRLGSMVLGALCVVVPLACVPLAMPRSDDGNPTYVPLLRAIHHAPVQPAFDWEPPTPAPAGETWTPAAIDRQLPRAQRMVNSPGWFTFGPDASDVFAARSVLKARVFWSAITACLASLGVVVLRRTRGRAPWTPSFRRYFPTLWPTQVSA
jgi:hypothetical protein